MPQRFSCFARIVQFNPNGFPLNRGRLGCESLGRCAADAVLDANRTLTSWDKPVDIAAESDLSDGVA